MTSKTSKAIVLATAMTFAGSTALQAQTTDMEALIAAAKPRAR